MPNPYDELDQPDSTQPPTVDPDGAGSGTQPSQPSFTQRLLSTLGKTGQAADDEVRLAVNGMTLGKFDQMLGPAEVAKTEAARQRINPAIGTAAEAGGFVMGRSLFPPGPTGLLPFVGESSIASGIQATGSNRTPQDVGTAMQKGAETAPFMYGLGRIGSYIGGKVAGMLPSWAGGLPPPPTSADVLNPRKLGGYTFISNADKDAANKLNILQNIEYNAKNTGATIPSQIGSLLSKNVETGTSQADNLGFQPTEQDALAKVGKTTPVSSFVVQHPRPAMRAMEPITEVPEMMSSFEGNPLKGIGAGLIGAAVDIGGYQGASYLARRGVQSSLDAAKRTIAGQPTSTQAQQWFKDSGSTALHRILLGSYLRQQQGQQSKNPYDALQ